jgi:hypothetical protein
MTLEVSLFLPYLHASQASGSQHCTVGYTVIVVVQLLRNGLILTHPFIMHHRHLRASMCLHIPDLLPLPVQAPVVIADCGEL